MMMLDFSWDFRSHSYLSRAIRATIQRLKNRSRSYGLLTRQAMQPGTCPALTSTTTPHLTSHQLRFDILALPFSLKFALSVGIPIQKCLGLGTYLIEPISIIVVISMRLGPYKTGAAALNGFSQLLRTCQRHGETQKEVNSTGII